MNKIFMLAFANIRKTKGNTISLFIMFLIAALLLNAGFLVFINFGNFFEKTTTELNTSNTYYIMPNHLYNNQVESYIKNDANVLNSQKEEVLSAKAVIKYKTDTREQAFLFSDADITRSMSQWKFVGAHLPNEGMSIYVPYIYQLDGGYKLNDKFEIILKDKKITFTIKGFTEDVFFSSEETSLMGVYLPHDTYTTVSNELGSINKSTLVFVNQKNINKDLETGIRELTKAAVVSASTDLTSTLFSFDLTNIKLSRVMLATMVSVIFVAFAVIIVSVCLVVVRFRIGNSIEDDMTKIGSLKAIGYTSRQIIFSIIAQFGLIAFVGSIAGICLSYLATPALSDVFAIQSGFRWVQSFDAKISSVTLCLILFIVGIVAFFAARRINKLNPIVALRGGIITHSFRKNHLPLSNSKGSLPIVLAFKSILQNMKQSVMITVIIISVSFSAVFAVVMFYNTVIDTTTFAETPGFELSNAIAVLKTDTDNSKIIENIKNMSDVRKVQFLDESIATINKNSINIFVMDDYSKKETNTIYQGRYPLHSNEIVLAGDLASMLKKSIGDNVTLKEGDTEAQFLITGLSQGSYGVMSASLRSDGITKLNPNFKQQTVQIYLNKDVNAGTFVKKLKNIYGDRIVSAFDVDSELALGMGVYISIVSKVGISILVVTLAVVILVLYFVINSSIIRKKRELGIQKAIGFTTFQLMNQLSIGFLPPIIAGACIGILLGTTQTNPIMSLTQRSMGIMKANYIINPAWITLLGVSIVIVSYVTSMLITYRIRKISAYSLVSE